MKEKEPIILHTQTINTNMIHDLTSANLVQMNSTTLPNSCKTIQLVVHVVFF